LAGLDNLTTMENHSLFGVKIVYLPHSGLKSVNTRHIKQTEDFE